MPDALTGLLVAADEAPTYDVAFVPPEWVLVLLGFTMVLAFMTLIMTKRLTPMVALILVPTVFGLFAGAGLGLGDMILDSISTMAPTAALLMFAIMFFGIMIDVGLFDPLIRLITRLLGDDPAKVVLGTAILAGAVSLDGDGSTTFIITTSAMLPIYLRLGMSPVVLTCVAGLMNGTLNIVPWGGPTVRAATALGLQPTDIFVPMLPALGVGILVTLSFAWLLGLGERRRLGRLDSAGLLTGGEGGALSTVPKIFRGSDAKPGARAALRTGNIVVVAGGRAPVPAASVDPADTAMADTMLDPARPTLRPKLIWFNLVLTLAVMVLLILDIMPLPYVFMVGAGIALLVNFRGIKDQASEIVAHAPSIVGVVSMVIAAGVLVGVLSGTGMVDAMATWITDVSLARTVPRADHRGAVDPVHVLHVERRVLLRHPARALAECGRIRDRPGGDGPRIDHRAAGAPAEPARPGHPAARLAGRGEPRRPPPQGALARDDRVSGDAGDRHRLGSDPVLRGSVTPGPRTH